MRAQLAAAHDAGLPDGWRVTIQLRVALERGRQRVDKQFVSPGGAKFRSLPQALVSMVTKKVAGSIVTTLMREAQKISAVDADTPAGGAAAAAVAHDNPYLQRVQQESRESAGSFYAHIGEVLRRHFEMFGEEAPMDDERPMP